MRLALLALLLLAAPVHGQLLPATVEARFGAVPSVLEGNGTLVQEVPVTLTVSGFLCTEDTAIRVPLSASGNATAAFTPSELVFTVPAGTTLVTPFVQEQRVALAVTLPRPNTTAAVDLIAGTPTGTCNAVGGVTHSGDGAQLMATWPEEEPVEVAPEQIMPLGPAWAGVLLALVLVRRGPLDHGPK